MSEIARRVALVRERIARAAAAAGRDPSGIRLIAVSKLQAPEAIREAYAAGLRDFGENYVQELARKAADLADLVDLRLHMIGHLQRNKVRQVVQVASAIHSVDSVRLAEELGRRTAEHGRDRLVTLIEVNVGGENEKTGCAPSDLESLVRAVEAQPALRLVGLMTMPPHTEDPAGARPYFEALVALRQLVGGPDRFPELSMGMTHDLEPAIAAGATMVRVGTAIFGSRP